MDFFAGSGSTGHGVNRYNIKNSVKANYILVQLPEELNYDDKNQKAGYLFCEKHSLAKEIPSLTKERLKRVAQQLKSENPSLDLDYGFRVLKVDTSNMSDIYYSPDQISQGNLELLVNNIKEDRTDEDLLFQVLLDWGVDLTLPIRKETICNKTVFFVDDNALVACFDTNITEELIKELAGLDPLRVVFRDDAFVSDAVKINADQIFKQLAPGTEVKSI